MTVLCRGPAQAQPSRATCGDDHWACRVPLLFQVALFQVWSGGWHGLWTSARKTWRSPRKLARVKEKRIAQLPLRESRGTQIMQQKQKTANEKSMQSRDRWCLFGRPGCYSQLGVSWALWSRFWGSRQSYVITYPYKTFSLT